MVTKREASTVATSTKGKSPAKKPAVKKSTVRKTPAGVTKSAGAEKTGKKSRKTATSVQKKTTKRMQNATGQNHPQTNQTPNKHCGNKKICTSIVWIVLGVTVALILIGSL